MNKPAEMKSDGTVANLVCLLKIVSRWIWPPKLQPILTLLTMAIGSLSLTATIFISSGALQNLWKDLDRLMGNRLDILADTGPNDIILQTRPSADFSVRDLEYLKEQTPWAKYIAPMFSARKEAKSSSAALFMEVDGIEESLEKEELYVPLRGRGFSEAARNGMMLECLATETAAASLRLPFPETSYIALGPQRFLVVGITPDPPETEIRFRNRIVLPYRCAQIYFGDVSRIKFIVVAWQKPQDMEKTVEAVTRALDQCRGPGTYYFSSSKFKIQSGQRIVNQFMLLGSAQSFFLIFIASMGIVNVMLSNVVRRTKEFAVRLVMGADHKDLSLLMLLESFILGIAGAVTGIALAIFVTPAITHILSSRIQEATNLQYSLSIKGFLYPILVCGLSSIIAGLVPAWRAGRLDLLSSLRAE